MRDRLDLSLLLVAHGGLLAAIVGRGSPWATASIDCVTPTLAAVALSEPAWTLGESLDTLVGGQLLAALIGLPAFALLGTGGAVGKGLAVLTSMGVVALVWAVLRPAGRGAAALGAAGVAFAPPLVVHASTIFGNWHYSQAAFDYGLALLALGLVSPQRAAAGPRVRAAWWAAFGLVAGLAVANSLGSVPFVAAVIVGLAAVGRRDVLPGIGPAGVGFAIGAAPLVGRLLGRSEDATVARLLDVRPNAGVLPGLVHPDLPWTLHMHDLAPSSWLDVVFTLESAWVVCAWAGVVAAGVWVVRGVRRGSVSRRAALGVAVPLAFVLVFVAAAVALDLRIERIAARYTNVRDHTHRVFPPLLLAMAAAAGPGWAAAWRWAATLQAPLRGAARGVVVVGGGTVPVLGAVAGLTILASAPGGGPAYRGACFDVAGYANAGALGTGAAAARCEALSTPGRRADCLAGVAWGTGFHVARIEGRGSSGGADRCSHAPPDVRDRCAGWSPGEVPGVGDEVVEACGAMPDEHRGLCAMGAGWFVAGFGRHWTDAPLRACESFPEPRDRDACWRGPGFIVADHLHATPGRVAAVLEELPRGRRAAAAWGAGYSVGRTYAGERQARALCDGLGELGDPCRAGVSQARAHTGGSP